MFARIDYEYTGIRHEEHGIRSVVVIKEVKIVSDLLDDCGLPRVRFLYARTSGSDREQRDSNCDNSFHIHSDDTSANVTSSYVRMLASFSGGFPMESEEPAIFHF